MRVFGLFGPSSLLPLNIAVPALAGPNAGGTIFCHDASEAWTIDLSTYCGVGVAPASCTAADPEIDGASGTGPMVWQVYAAFPDGSSPRLKAMTFGIHYDDPIQLVARGPCLDFDSPCPMWGCDTPGPGWPGSDSGDALVWQDTPTAALIEVYWFAGYNYGGVPATFSLRDNPDPGYGGQFADDSQPAQLDPIAGYGSIGFDQPGEVACPASPVPTMTTTWGWVKSVFR